MIKFDKKSKSFYAAKSSGEGYRRLQGLHKVLAKQFYPANSNFDNIRKWKFSPKAARQQLLTPAGKPLRRLTNRQAVSLGKRVDKQMQVLVEAAEGDPLKLRHWITFKREQKTLADYNKKYPKRPIAKLEPFAAAGLKCLLDNNWVPIACQVTVGSVEHGFATNIDVKCKHNDERAVIEVKCGYESTWQSHTKQKLKAPLEDLWDTDQNKAHLQSAAGALLDKAYNGLNKLPKVYVLHITKVHGARLEPLLEPIAKKLQLVANQLVSK